MKDSTFKRLDELSLKTKDKALIPLLVDYYKFENIGSEEEVIDLIERKYNLFKS